jgi:hypothetical protein
MCAQTTATLARHAAKMHAKPLVAPKTPVREGIGMLRYDRLATGARFS